MSNGEAVLNKYNELSPRDQQRLVAEIEDLFDEYGVDLPFHPSDLFGDDSDQLNQILSFDLDIYNDEVDQMVEEIQSWNTPVVESDIDQNSTLAELVLLIIEVSY